MAAAAEASGVCLTTQAGRQLHMLLESRDTTSCHPAEGNPLTNQPPSSIPGANPPLHGLYQTISPTF